MKGLLIALMPDEALPIVIVGIGIALILGIINRKTAFSFLAIIIIFMLLIPFIDALFESLPLWLLLLLMVGFSFIILRLILNTILGREVTGHFLGTLLFTIFSLPFRLIGYLFRGRGRGI
jgi:prepilin signal peptidase PulO-like enzyme (type II secretory pathway)